MKRLLLILVLSLFSSFVNADYDDSSSFLKAEGATCKMATDGCNTVSIIDGKLGAMTMMYCVDIYGEKGQEKWSCLDKKLEDNTIGFLGENDKNDYKNIKVKLGEKLSQKIEIIVSDFGNRVLEFQKYDISKSVKRVDKAILAFDNAIFDLVMSYPADSSMSKQDTKKYNILKLARFELQIIKHRWEINYGISSN